MIRENVGHEAGREVEDGWDRVAREAFEQGRAEGVEQGRAEGVIEGARATLLMLLEARFGVVDAPVRARVVNASPAEIEAWTVRVLTATEPRHVFD